MHRPTSRREIAISRAWGGWGSVRSVNIWRNTIGKKSNVSYLERTITPLPRQARLPLTLTGSKKFYVQRKLAHMSNATHGRDD